jgi:hypothetical protein
MNTFHQSTSIRILPVTLACLIALILYLTLAFPGMASGGEVTRGDFQTYASGPGLGYDISGHARMTRTADGKTIVSVHAVGLLPDTDYGVHVHNKACSDNNGGGHYQNVVGGAVDAINEIWPLFTTNAAGIGNGYASNDFHARPEAQAVVIHAPGGARIACADLE